MEKEPRRVLRVLLAGAVSSGTPDDWGLHGKRGGRKASLWKGHRCWIAAGKDEIDARKCLAPVEPDVVIYRANHRDEYVTISHAGGCQSVSSSDGSIAAVLTDITPAPWKCLEIGQGGVQYDVATGTVKATRPENHPSPKGVSGRPADLVALIVECLSSGAEPTEDWLSLFFPPKRTKKSETLRGLSNELAKFSEAFGSFSLPLLRPVVIVKGRGRLAEGVRAVRESKIGRAHV